MEQHGDEWAASYHDDAGVLKGFALLGSQLQQQRSEWLEKLNKSSAAA